MVNMERTGMMSCNGSPKLARALYTNTPEAKNELFFRKGDILQVLEFNYQKQSGWWLCTLLGQSGICPGNYLELLEHDYQNEGEDSTPCYDVPKSYYPLPATTNLLDLYDIPRNQSPIYASATLVRSKKHSDSLSLRSTGSTNRASSASSVSSSAQSSSSSCSEASFPKFRTLRSIDTEVTYSNDTTLRDLERLSLSPTPPPRPQRPSIQNSLDLDYDVPRSPKPVGNETSSRPPSSSSDLCPGRLMSGSRSCVTLRSSDSKESLDLYDTPRSVVKNCVSIFENKYDHVQYRPPPNVASRKDASMASKRSSISSTASSSNSSTTNTNLGSIETHLGIILRNAGSLKNADSICSVSSRNDEAYDRPSGSPRSWSLSTSSNLDTSYDMPRTSICDSTDTLSCQGQVDRRRPLTHDNSRTSLTNSINFEQSPSSSLPADVKILPLCPKAAVTICEKLRQEVITSINAILNFVKPKWRLKENLVEIMPDLRFGCVRLNLAMKDFADFCSRTVSNSKKFKLETLVIRLQKLLAPLSSASQIIQKDVDELEAYLWSIDRLSIPAHEKESTGDALDQLALCARSLQYDVTEIANFIALNSTPLFQEVGEVEKPAQVLASARTTVEEGQEDYDYVTLSSIPNEEAIKVTENVNLINSRDQQILEFYSAQIAATTPLLSQSISAFISSVHQNDPPRIFNGHLKYVILLAYKMLFAGDTIHRNLSHEEVKVEVEVKADELHKAVVSLHEASKLATRDFPKIVPMQRIIDHVWETTSAAAQLKKVIFNATL